MDKGMADDGQPGGACQRAVRSEARAHVLSDCPGRKWVTTYW
jgi:hypothetical protein